MATSGVLVEPPSSDTPKGTQFQINYRNQVLFWRPPNPSAKRQDVAEWNVNYKDLIAVIQQKWDIKASDIKEKWIQIKHTPPGNTHDFFPDHLPSAHCTTISNGKELCSVWHHFREHFGGSFKVISINLVYDAECKLNGDLDHLDIKEIECDSETDRLPTSPVIGNLTSTQMDDLQKAIASMRREDTDSTLENVDVSLPSSTANSTAKSSRRSSKNSNKLKAPPMPITDQLDRQMVMDQLRVLGVEEQYIVRTMKLYDKHYRDEYEYSIDIIIEIMYRLKINDKLKKQKKTQTLFKSKSEIEKIMSQNFKEIPAHFVQRGITEYLERNINPTESNKDGTPFNTVRITEYDLVEIIEIIMNFRAENRSRRQSFAAKKRRNTHLSDSSYRTRSHHRKHSHHSDRSDRSDRGDRNQHSDHSKREKVSVFVTAVSSADSDSATNPITNSTTNSTLNSTVNPEFLTQSKPLRVSKQIKYRDLVRKMGRRLSVDCDMRMMYTVDGHNETIPICDDEDIHSMLLQAERGRVDITVAVNENAGAGMSDDDLSTSSESSSRIAEDAPVGCVRGDMACIPGISQQDGDCVVL